MNAISSALDSIRADQAKELRLAQETREQIFQAIVREAFGQSGENDVLIVRRAIESKVFSARELEELVELAAQLSAAKIAQSEIVVVQKQETDAKDHFRVLCEKHEEARRLAKEHWHQTSEAVTQLRHCINRAPTIKSTHPELYAHWEQLESQLAESSTHSKNPDLNGKKSKQQTSSPAST